MNDLFDDYDDDDGEAEADAAIDRKHHNCNTLHISYTVLIGLQCNLPQLDIRLIKLICRQLEGKKRAQFEMRAHSTASKVRAWYK